MSDYYHQHCYHLQTLQSPTASSPSSVQCYHCLNASVPSSFSTTLTSQHYCCRSTTTTNNNNKFADNSEDLLLIKILLILILLFYHFELIPLLLVVLGLFHTYNSSRFDCGFNSKLKVWDIRRSVMKTILGSSTLNFEHPCDSTVGGAVGAKTTPPPPAIMSSSICDTTSSSFVSNEQQIRPTIATLDCDDYDDIRLESACSSSASTYHPQLTPSPSTPEQTRARDKRLSSLSPPPPAYHHHHHSHLHYDDDMMSLASSSSATASSRDASSLNHKLGSSSSGCSTPTSSSVYHPSSVSPSLRARSSMAPLGFTGGDDTSDDDLDDLNYQLHPPKPTYNIYRHRHSTPMPHQYYSTSTLSKRHSLFPETFSPLEASSSPPPPPPLPHNNHLPNLNHHHHLPKSTSTIHLGAILEVFQCNISESQAWALIYQSVKSLSQFISDYESNCSASSLGGESVHSLEIVELNAAGDLVLDFHGNVSERTWIPKYRNSPNSITIKNANSINAVVSQLAVIIYQAITFNWKESSSGKKAEKELLETNLDDEEDEEDDIEPELEESLEELMLTMMRSKQQNENPIVDEGYIDEEERLLSHLSKSCIPSVLDKCTERFQSQLMNLEVATSNDDKGSVDCCPILANMHENVSGDQNPELNVDTYYRTVCQHLVDEFSKLRKLLNQLVDTTDAGASTKSKRKQSRFALESEKPDTETLKIWAQTWIKVMSELRFGVHLRPTNLDEPDSRMGPPPPPPEQPFNSLMEQIRSTTLSQLRDSFNAAPEYDSKRYTARERYHHSVSLPVIDYRISISSDVVRERLNSLKPSSERPVKPLPPKELTLHEKLMNSIHKYDSVKLNHVTTVVKPDVAKLYKQEKEESIRLRQQTSFTQRPKSATFLHYQLENEYDHYQYQPYQTYHHHQTRPLSSVAYSTSLTQAQAAADDIFDVLSSDKDMSTSTSSLGHVACRCPSSPNSVHHHLMHHKHRPEPTTQQFAPNDQIKQSTAVDHLQQGNFFRRFRSMVIKTGSSKDKDSSKRKNMAADDSFTTSLTRSPIRSSIHSIPTQSSTSSTSTSTTVITSQPSQLGGSRRYSKNSKKTRNHPEMFSAMSSSMPTKSSILANSSPQMFNQVNNSSSTQTQYRPAPIQIPSRSVVSLNQESQSLSKCPKHYPNYNSSFLHSAYVKCTCPDLCSQSSSPLINPKFKGSTSSIQSNSSLSSVTSSHLKPLPPFNANFAHNTHLRRSYMKPKSAAASSHFEYLNQAYGSMKRSNSVMFPKERTVSNLSQSKNTSSSTKWVSNFFTKIISNLTPTVSASSGSVGHLKVKKE